MNHDICHCKGENCELRELCRRYAAHLDAQKMKYKHIQYCVPQNTGTRCELFFRNHEGN